MVKGTKMLETIVKKIESHPVITRMVEGAIAGYFVVSPTLMILSDKMHQNHFHTNQSILNSLKESFTPEFLPWALTYTALTGAITGIVAYFSNRARTLVEINHGIEKETIQIRLNIEKNNLQTKLKHYEDLVNEFHFGVYTSNLDGKFQTANSILVNMLGYDTVDELLKVPVEELYADKYEREEFISELEKKEAVYDKTLTLKRKDGKYVRFMCDAKRNGNIKGFIFELPEYQKDTLVMCGECLKIREGPAKTGIWKKPADYFRDNYNIQTSHGLCQPCADKLYPNMFK